MGTGKSGRYLNTKGSARCVSDYAIIHSSEGTFRKTQNRINGKVLFKMRLVSGGHSQDNIDLLDKFKIKYKITKTYSNGVRIGNVENHPHRSKREESKQAWFPKNWTKKDIKKSRRTCGKFKNK